MDTELVPQPLDRVEILADRVAGFLRLSPDSPRLIGADAAVRWVAGRTMDRPVKQGRITAAEWSVREEMHMAVMALRRATTPDTAAYFTGVGVVLEWATGFTEGIPRWLITYSEATSAPTESAAS